MSDRPVPAYSDKIVSIKPLGNDAYHLVIEISNIKTVELICRVFPARLKTGKETHRCEIDSSEYGSEVMSGNINSRGVLKQVVEFHKKLNAIAEQKPEG